MGKARKLEAYAGVFSGQIFGNIGKSLRKSCFWAPWNL